MKSMVSCVFRCFLFCVMNPCKGDAAISVIHPFFFTVLVIVFRSESENTCGSDYLGAVIYNTTNDVVSSESKPQASSGTASLFRNCLQSNHFVVDNVTAQTLRQPIFQKPKKPSRVIVSESKSKHTCVFLEY